MSVFRVGNHWGVTIVKEGEGLPDQDGHREGDELVGFMFNKDMAAHVVRLLNDNEAWNR